MRLPHLFYIFQGTPCSGVPYIYPSPLFHAVGRSALTPARDGYGPSIPNDVKVPGIAPGRPCPRISGETAYDHFERRQHFVQQSFCWGCPETHMPHMRLPAEIQHRNPLCLCSASFPLTAGTGHRQRCWGFVSVVWIHSSEEYAAWQLNPCFCILIFSFGHDI